MTSSQTARTCSSTLLGHTNSLTPATSGLGVLSTHTKAPVVTQTTVIPDLLEPLEIIPELHVQGIGNNLGIFTIFVVFLSVEKPVRNLELAGICHNVHQVLNLLSRQLSSPLVHVDVGFLADDVSETTTDTLDRGESKHDLLLPIDVRVHHTQNMLELLVRYERHG